MLTDDGMPLCAVSMMEFREGLVVNETQYFSYRFDPAPSRTHLVERAGEITSCWTHRRGEPGSASMQQPACPNRPSGRANARTGWAQPAYELPARCRLSEQLSFVLATI